MTKILIEEAVVRQALECLDGVWRGDYNGNAEEAITALRQALEQPDRQALQAAGIHPAPCARHCEANAFEIAARGMRKQITELQEALAEQPAPAQEPAAWSVTWDGVHCGNFYFREQDAREHKARLDAKRPGEKREVVPLYTTPPAPAQEPLTPGFAGVTLWLGDARVTQIVTETQIKYEREPGSALTHAAQKCLDLYAGAHGITKGGAT